MPKKKAKLAEYFYFTIDDWTRNYRFEVNRHRWEMSPDHYAERDEIMIAGRLRSKTKRKFVAGEAHIRPSYVPRSEQEKIGAEQIGNVWTMPGRIYCSAFIPVDAYYSLPECLASGKFVEMEWRVNDLKRRKGEMDALKLNWAYSDLDEDLRNCENESPASVDPQY